MLLVINNAKTRDGTEVLATWGVHQLCMPNDPSGVAFAFVDMASSAMGTLSVGCRTLYCCKSGPRTCTVSMQHYRRPVPIHAEMKRDISGLLTSQQRVFLEYHSAPHQPNQDAGIVDVMDARVTIPVDAFQAIAEFLICKLATAPLCSCS